MCVCDGGCLCGEGRYEGPVHEAKAWFRRQGFVMPEGVNLGDFVVDCTMGLIRSTRDSVMGEWRWVGVGWWCE